MAKPLLDCQCWDILLSETCALPLVLMDNLLSLLYNKNTLLPWAFTLFQMPGTHVDYQSSVY